MTAFSEVAAIDGVLTESEESDLLSLLQHFQTDWEEVAARFPSLHDALIVAKVGRGWLPTLPETRLLTKKGEVVHFEAAAAVMKEVIEREWRGGSSGVSIPLGRGFRYRVGSVRGKTVVVGSHLEVEDAGQLIVSSQRIVFMGQKRTLDVPFARLTGVELFTDGLLVHSSARQKPTLLRLPSPVTLGAILNEAYARFEGAGSQASVQTLQAEPAQSVEELSEPSGLIPPEVQAKVDQMWAEEEARVKAVGAKALGDLVFDVLRPALLDYAEACHASREASKEVDRLVEDDTSPMEEFEAASDVAREKHDWRFRAGIRISVLLYEIRDRYWRLEETESPEIERHKEQSLSGLPHGDVALRIASTETEDDDESDFLEGMLLARFGYTPDAASEFVSGLRGSPQLIEPSLALAAANQTKELFDLVGLRVNLLQER